ncbi:MAG: hypothetical protein GKR94_20100 [Gammaproteobacteria bacterium]|nr:hypothetical protein [Gammaproteobacteria bacterium]
MDAQQADLDIDPAPDDARSGLAGAPVRERMAVGPLAGQRTMRLRVAARAEALPSTRGALTASHDAASASMRRWPVARVSAISPAALP